jgi:hypothetical protein
MARRRVWLRRGRRRGQLLFGPQVPWAGDRGSYGNTNLGAIQRHGRMGGMDQSRTGDDKTNIVVIADFWERTGGLFSRDRDISSNTFQIPWGGGDNRSGPIPGKLGGIPGMRLIPACFSARAVCRYPA